MTQDVDRRCMCCQPCKDWAKQRAAYAAAISEARDDPSRAEALRASWNSLQEDEDFSCSQLK